MIRSVGVLADGCEATTDAQRVRSGVIESESEALPVTGPRRDAQQRLRRRRKPYRGTTTTVLALLVSGAHTTLAQSCISLKQSTACPAFNASSISTDSDLVGLFPFLSSVTNTSSFDSAIQSYISGSFARTRYENLIGCSDFHSDNTTSFYARYTESVLCNAIVQNSIRPCTLSGDATRPLCADSCADYAQSEQEISASNICGTAGPNALSQIRADFTNCALPANSLAQTCIEAVSNQPDDCGFASNLGGLCSYCSATSPNSTDSCCVFSNTSTRCVGVSLPVVASSSLRPITVTATGTAATSSSTSGSPVTAAAHKGLTGGQIAGIVIGAVLGALALLGLLIFGCLLLRRRRESSPATSVFNQPSTARHQPAMAFNDGAEEQERAGLAVLPGARVARMSALENSDGSERAGDGYTPAGVFRKSLDNLETPDSRQSGAGNAPPRRGGSLSSQSHFAAIAGGHELDSSPSSNNDFTSPESQNHSEQLEFFKDYYSQDEIRPGDLVSTLWAYEPRAADEFHLERGDMIKVLGIWDDGWATGVRVRQKAEDWRPEGKTQRDSGVSNGSSSKSRPPDTADEGEIKAFPLVCVCLPQHWRKTIEGDSTEGSGPAAGDSNQP